VVDSSNDLDGPLVYNAGQLISVEESPVRLVRSAGKFSVVTNNLGSAAFTDGAPLLSQQKFYRAQFTP